MDNLFINNLFDFIQFYNKYFYSSGLKKDYFMMIMKYNNLNMFYHEMCVYDFIRLCISNMYKNILTIYNYHELFFINNKIREDMNLEDIDDVNNLFDFMQKIIACNFDNDDVKYVFIPLISGLSDYVDYSKDNVKKMEREYLIMFSNGWNNLISNFV